MDCNSCCHKFEEMDWPFKMPKKMVVLTSRKVLEEDAPIHYVSHDAEDRVWQFHPHEDLGEEGADVRMTSLKSIFLRDESIAKLADLPEGWHAWRETPDGEWQREKID